MDDYRVIIAGSRSFSNYELLREHCLFLLQEKMRTHRVIIVCTFYFIYNYILVCQQKTLYGTLFVKSMLPSLNSVFHFDIVTTISPFNTSFKKLQQLS